MRYITMQTIRGTASLVIDTEGHQAPREVNGPNHAMEAERLAGALNLENEIEADDCIIWPAADEADVADEQPISAIQWGDR